MANSTLITDYLGKGTSAARPTSPPIAAGALALYFATDTRQLSEWDGAAWNDVGVVSLASGHLLANATGSSAPPADTSLTAFLDYVLGSARGSLARRGASGWTSLGPGAAGAALLTGGSGADPSWVALAGSNVAGVELLSHKGAASGYAGLDSGGKVPSSQLPSGLTGGLIFSGGWDAAANDLLLTDTPAAQGTFYVVTTAGTTPINTRTGSVTQWDLGDVIFSDGTYWDKLDGQGSEVVTVAGRTGAVTLTHSDLTDWASATASFLTSQLWNAGTVTALAGASVGAGTLAVTYGTVAGTAAQGNDSRITGAEQTANKGIAGGYAGLDGSGKVPTANLPAAVAGALSFAGAWNASTNSPTLTNTPAAQGNFYIVTVAGTTALTTRIGSVSQWNLGDVIFSDGTYWDKLDGQSSEVVTVAGRTGAVTLTHADITDFATSAVTSLNIGTVAVAGGITLAAGTGVSLGVAGSIVTLTNTTTAAATVLTVGTVANTGTVALIAGADMALTATGTSVTITNTNTALATDIDVAFGTIAAGDRIRSDGTRWINGREPYVVAASIGTITGTTTNQVLYGHKFAAPVTFPANFGTTTAGALSAAEAFVNATSLSAFVLGKCPAASDPTVGGNWTSIGTVTIAAGGHTGTLVSSGGTAVAFAIGDKLRVLGSPDTTLANVNITLAGDR